AVPAHHPPSPGERSRRLAGTDHRGNHGPMQTGAGPGAAELDELLITVVVDNATDTLSSIPDGIPQGPEMVHLLEGPVIGTHDGHAMAAVFQRCCVAFHGVSVLATGRRGEDAVTVLFDVGPYGDVWLGNAERLGVDPLEIGVPFGVNCRG